MLVDPAHQQAAAGLGMLQASGDHVLVANVIARILNTPAD